MKWTQGKPLPLGVTKEENRVNFSISVPRGSVCELLLYSESADAPIAVYEMAENLLFGEVRYAALELEETEKNNYEYIYRVDQKYYLDPYAKALSGTKEWGEQTDFSDGSVRAKITMQEYQWEEDTPLDLPFHKVVAYSLHVRGFTKHPSSKVKHKGTFRGVIEKIPYLKDLGINQIHCMPVYEFNETAGRKINYWGYGPGLFFAPKNAYAACGDGSRELKDMVKACHRAGIEVVLEMPFYAGTPKIMMEECLRYYRIEYHIDGFILNPVLAPMDAIMADPILKCSRILTHQDDFQNVMRRFLKGDEGMIEGVIYWLNHHTDHHHNYITGQTGFTLRDLVSYDGKHNEANGEHNQDGTDYNYSWNCGAEGPSRKKAVKELRKNQMRNAFFLLLFAQGTPCLLAGDEFGNTQGGNNNVYCQDNTTGWVDWSRLRREEEMYQFVKGLIQLRKDHPVFMQKEPLRGMDTARCGVPDISYHGEYAWRTPSEVASRQLGIYYSGTAIGDEDCFVIYNMHWVEHDFALPALAGGKKWYVIANTEEGVLEKPLLLENQHDTPVGERRIVILAGRTGDEDSDRRDETDA